jgi:hypothetical protein
MRPTLVVTGRSAARAYAQPAAELKRLTEAGALLKVARGIFVAVPVHRRAGDWLPSMEDLALAVAVAVHGVDHGALWGLSAARLHGALPRAIATGFVLGPRQHRAIPLAARPGSVECVKRDPERRDLELVTTEVGPGLVTTVAQTILDLSGRDFHAEDDLRREAVRALMVRVDVAELEDLARRVRGNAALRRAQRLGADAV